MQAGFDAFLESGLCTDAVDQGHHAWHEPMSTLQQLKVQTFLKMSRMFSQASPAEDYNVTKMKLESMLVVIGYGLFVTIVTTMCEYGRCRAHFRVPVIASRGTTIGGTDTFGFNDLLPCKMCADKQACVRYGQLGIAAGQ